MATLLRTGFGAGVTLSAALNSPGTDWYHTLTGGDDLNDVDDFPGQEAGTVMQQQAMVDENSTFTDYVVTEIRNVTGPRGDSTNVLYHQVLQNDPATPSTTRSQWRIKVDALSDSAWHYRCDLMLNAETADILKNGATQWYLFNEWLGPSDDIAWEMPYSLGADLQFWQIERKGGTTWTSDGQTVPVPLGVWFRVDLYHYGDAEQGCCRIFVNNKLAVAKRGDTDIGAITQFQGPKCYAGAASYVEGPLDQHIDNLELHNSWDSGSTKPIMDHPVRGHPVAAVQPVGEV